MSKKSQQKKSRNYVPGNIERQVLFEAGYKCSVPHCGQKAALDVHHIDYDRTNHAPANLLVMCPTCHRLATDKKIDRLACLMMKQQLKLKYASKSDLKQWKDAAIAEISNAVGSQETPKPLEDKDRGTRRPNSRVEVAAEQVLTYDKADIQLPADVLRSLAASFYHSGEVNASLEILRIVTKSDRVTAVDHFNVGFLLHKTGRKEEAEESYRLALDKDPTNAVAWSSLGNLLHDAGRREEADKGYRRSLELDRQDAMTWSNLGVLLGETDQWEDAEKAHRTALDLDPRIAGVWNNLGVSLEKTERREGAEEAYRKAVEVDAQFAEAWLNLGRLLKKTDGKEDAADAYKKASESGEYNADQHSNLAYALWECGRFDDAELEVMEALKDDPNHAYAHATLGLIRFEQNKLDEGRAGYEKAIEVKPDDLPLQQKYHYEYGRALARNKRPVDARHELEAALAVNANHVPREQIETALSALP